MKPVLSLLFVLFLLAPFSIAQQPPTETAPSAPAASLVVKHSPEGYPILEDGTPLHLRLTRALSSADAHAGDRVDFEVITPIVLDGVTVIPQGGIAWGTVLESEHKKVLSHPAKLDVAIVSVKLANADRANLRAIKESQGGKHTRSGGRVAAAVFFPPAAMAMRWKQGHDTVIPQGTEIIAYVDGDKTYVPAAKPTAPNGGELPPQH